MLNLFKFGLGFGTVCAASVSLMACTTSETGGSDKSQAAVVTTQKPGAAVTFVATAPKDLGVSENGVVSLKISDGYDAGTLRLTATTDQGLRFVTETSTQEFSMSGREAHEWELDVMAAEKGVYYVNIFAEATRPGFRTEYRTHAVRVQVGDLTEAEIKNTLKSNGNLSADGTVVTMQADEVIK